MGSALHRSVNRPERNELAYSDRSDNLNINTDLPYQAEVETSIKAMKEGKARGAFSLQAELLNADTTPLISQILDLSFMAKQISNDRCVVLCELNFDQVF